MSLKLYTLLSFLTYLSILFLFSILTSLLICIIQLNFEFWFLYLLRLINHIFEIYNLFYISIFFIIITLTTYYLKKLRNLFFMLLSSLLLVIILNYYDLKVLFCYKSQPIDQYFYLYLISYTVCVVVWYRILKKFWKIKHLI